MAWEIRWSNSRQTSYFYDPETNASQWNRPDGLSEEDARKLPGSEYLTQRPAGKVRASHLLVKHRDSRRPSSWKEAEITRSKEEAIEILRGYQAQINGDPEIFGELAQQHSDDSSHSRNGDLGFFGPGQMQKPFETATYALKVGEISDVISTDSGVHLILRTA